MRSPSERVHLVAQHNVLFLITFDALHSHSPSSDEQLEQELDSASVLAYVPSLILCRVSIRDVLVVPFSAQTYAIGLFMVR